MNITRRRLSLAAAAAFASPLRPAAAADELTVGLWGGDYADLMQKLVDGPFAARHGIQVQQLVGDQESRKTRLLAERRARASSMDVVCLSDTDMYAMSRHGLLEPLPAAGLPRLAAVTPALRRPYAVPHIYSHLAIVYNAARVDSPPRSYAELADARWRGKVGLSDAIYLATFQAAALAGGATGFDLEAGKKTLREWQRLGFRLYPSNEALTAALKSEEVLVTVMWMARGTMWQRAGLPVKAVVPREGAFAVCFEAAVPRNARSKTTAWHYLDALLDPATQRGFAERMGYAQTVADAGAADGPRLVATDYEAIMRQQPEVIDFWNKQFKR